MADETDVEIALAQLIAADLYPNGPGGAGAPPYPTKVYAGWPVAGRLEKDLKNGMVHVSVYAVPGVVSDPGQIMDTAPAVIVPPVKGLTVGGTTQAITFTGTPTLGEYASVIIQGKGYSYKAGAGDTASTVAAGLAALISAVHPGTYAIGSTLFLNPGPDGTVRTGAPVTMGQRIHRQRQQIRVITWAATPEARTAIAKRVDLAVKRVNVIELPDTTQALITATGAGPQDGFQLEGIYRRDLMLSATFDTLDTYTAYEITHVDLDIQPMAPVSNP